MSRDQIASKDHFNTPLAKCVVVNSYLNRIGAAFISMRHAAVTEELDGYPKEIARVAFSDEGDVNCTEPEYAPSESESALMRAEISAIKMPKPRAAPRHGSWPAGLEAEKRQGKATVYEVKDRKGNFLMLLARYENDSGKWFIPWSYWDDSEWRRCEPDGLLPLWGLENVTTGKPVFIHEGFKAAKACQAVAAPRDISEQQAAKNHPFVEYLSTGAHVGWHGGALSASRTDWDALKRYGATEVVVVADNDDAGRKAATTISKKVGLPAKLMQFSEEFPSGFDLADDFPEKMFKKESGRYRYIGPSPESLLHPATWATRPMPSSQSNKVVFGPTENFLKEWVFITNVGLFVHRDFPASRLTTATFNGQLRRFSDVRDVADLLIKHRMKEVPDICYRPDAPSGLVNAGDGQAFNVFTPARTKPLAGDVSPFLDFIAYLVPDPDEAKEVLKWCATLIAKPEVRMGYALLLISEAQGTGKTTLAEHILKPLVGYQNACIPGETMIVSDFNDWASCRRLVIVPEIYQGHSWKSYNRLKALITDQSIRVNEKHKPPYDIENWLHIVACSNSLKALKMEDSDRRWYVPKLTEKPWPQSFFKELYGWLETGGLEHVGQWANEHGDYVRRGEVAPRSAAKERMIAASNSEHIKDAGRLVEGLLESEDPCAFRLSHLMSVAKRQRAERCFDEPRDFSKALIKAGWVRYPDRLTFKSQKDHVLMNRAAEEAVFADPSNKTGLLREIIQSSRLDADPF
ncbi:DUF5906 domain-containing protein [Ascidiaceihabitans sp.]|nr:DUF5906 domain-containing protein [Ascidiaceihabitans sp.]